MTVQHESLKTQHGLMDLSNRAPWPFGWVGVWAGWPCCFQGTWTTTKHIPNPIGKHSSQSQGSAHARPAEGTPLINQGAPHYAGIKLHFTTVSRRTRRSHRSSRENERRSKSDSEGESALSFLSYNLVGVWLTWRSNSVRWSGQERETGRSIYEMRGNE